MGIVGFETRRPYFRAQTQLKMALPALRQTEHSKLVERVENFKKEVADLRVQLAEKDRQIEVLAAEIAQLESKLGSIVPALTEKITALEGTVAEKTYAMQAERFVSPTL